MRRQAAQVLSVCASKYGITDRKEECELLSAL